MDSYEVEIKMSVRDYECDIQGVVNNSVYQNYLEHARHEYLKSIGVDFKEYSDKGINLSVIRVELDYKGALTSGDNFSVTTTLQRESKIRIVFYQNIMRLSDTKLVLKGKVTGVALNAKGRPFMPEELEKIIR